MLIFWPFINLSSLVEWSDTKPKYIIRHNTTMMPRMWLNHTHILMENKYYCSNGKVAGLKQKGKKKSSKTHASKRFISNQKVVWLRRHQPFQRQGQPCQDWDRHLEDSATPVWRRWENKKNSQFILKQTKAPGNKEAFNSWLCKQMARHKQTPTWTRT